jgi:hypothetical protein
MKRFQHLLFILLLGIATSANSQTILNITVDPPNPTENQNISIIVDVAMPYSGCWIDFHTNTQLGNTFQIDANYCMGFAAAICYRTDTFDMAQLAADTYSLQFNMWNCNGTSMDDTMSYVFDVARPVGIFENATQKIESTVVPNPMSSSALLQFENPDGLVHELQINDVTGKLVYQQSGITTGQVELEKGKLKSGMYFYALFREKLVVSTGKLLVD